MRTYPAPTPPPASDEPERGNAIVPLGIMAVCVLLLLGGRLAHCQEPSASNQVSVGGGVVLSDNASAVPVVIIAADAPVFLGSHSAARIFAMLKLHGSQGQTVDPGDVATFREAELDVYAQRRIGSDRAGGSTYIYLHGGGAVRQNTSGNEPAQRTPLWWSVGIAADRRDGDHFPERRLAIGFGHSDLSSPPRVTPGTLGAVLRDGIPRDIVVSGFVTIKATGSLEIIIGGDAHRALWGPRATQAVRLTSTVTFGST